MGCRLQPRVPPEVLRVALQQREILLARLAVPADGEQQRGAPLAPAGAVRYLLFDCVEVVERLARESGRGGESLGEMGRDGESWGESGRGGESWGDLGRDGEIWGDLGRSGESWGEMGRDGEIWASAPPARGWRTRLPHRPQG